MTLKELIQWLPEVISQLPREVRIMAENIIEEFILYFYCSSPFVNNPEFLTQ